MKIHFSLFVLLIATAQSVIAIADTNLLKLPNFVFIQGEAQGWANASVQLDPANVESKSRAFFTPNLERLAKAGIRFSNYYAPSPRCTPSRATYFTGISPARLHMTMTNYEDDSGKPVSTPRGLSELPKEVLTIAELLKPAGYISAHFGKWHVGRADPRVHGFDESDGANNNGGPDNSSNPNPKQAYATAELGMDFMQRQVLANNPFYLQISHYGGRSEADALPATFERTLKMGLGREDQDVGNAAVILDMDITIGMILDKLNELGIADNTYIFYTADHGSQGRNGPLQGGKGGLWEGGIRIPLLIAGPKVVPGAHTSIRATGADLVPTIADLAGLAAAIPKEVEGGSLRDVLANPDKGLVTRKYEDLIFHFPHYDKDRLGPVSAILHDEYKLLRIYEGNRRFLFDL
jgi:arylsulfatase A